MFAFLKPRSQVRFLPGTLLSRCIQRAGASVLGALGAPKRGVRGTNSVHASVPLAPASDDDVCGKAWRKVACPS